MVLFVNMSLVSWTELRQEKHRHNRQPHSRSTEHLTRKERPFERDYLNDTRLTGMAWTKTNLLEKAVHLTCLRAKAIYFSFVDFSHY